MTPELQAAIKRYRTDDYPETVDGTFRWEADLELLADAYIADLDRREAAECDAGVATDVVMCAKAVGLLFRTDDEAEMKTARWKAAMRLKNTILAEADRRDAERVKP